MFASDMNVHLAGIIVAADRGYTNPSYILDSVGKGAEGFIGTHQRNLQMPFTFGRNLGQCR